MSILDKGYFRNLCCRMYEIPHKEALQDKLNLFPYPFNKELIT